MPRQFPSLFGNTTDDKKDVVQDVWWFLTGARNETCVFRASGSSFFAAMSAHADSRSYAYKGEGVS